MLYDVMLCSVVLYYTISYYIILKIIVCLIIWYNIISYAEPCKQSRAFTVLVPDLAQAREELFGKSQPEQICSSSAPYPAPPYTAKNPVKSFRRQKASTYSDLRSSSAMLVTFFWTRTTLQSDTAGFLVTVAESGKDVDC